ncbi:MAG: aminopeptidase [Patescibacteria group bacterium]|jgi:aspartyl aminopeptidase
MAKKDYKKIEEQLKLERRNAWNVWDEKVKKEAFSFAEGYKKFLSQVKTEREAVVYGIKAAKAAGFRDIKEMKSLKTGDKVYAVNRGRNLFLARIGKKPLAGGLRMLMSHVDAPHLDLKITPLYEDENVAFLKTHYYGGIKKYQWPTIALALHGVVHLENGKDVEIVIGEKESDPVFMITDLLPHLDRAGGPGTAPKNREVRGEDLNLVIGSLPVKDEKIKEKVKLAILEHLYSEYGIIEEDLTSAELQVVPAEKARDLGFDRSMVSGFGQDDRSCSYGIFQSMLDSGPAGQTQIMVWTEREEIGSEGNTGARSYAFESFVLEISRLAEKKTSMEEIYNIFSESQAVSADVTAAVDPDYKDVFDLRNAQRLGSGVVIEKYTGAGGKYSTSEASAKFIQELRAIFRKNKNIVYQIGGGIGKVDTGGGGTIAKFLANRNMEVVDMGIPLFNMHAPLEISSKGDLYCSYLAYKAFLEA